MTVWRRKPWTTIIPDTVNPDDHVTLRAPNSTIFDTRVALHVARLARHVGSFAVLVQSTWNQSLVNGVSRPFLCSFLFPSFPFILLSFSLFASFLPFPSFPFLFLFVLMCLPSPPPPPNTLFSSSPDPWFLTFDRVVDSHRVSCEEMLNQQSQYFTDEKLVQPADQLKND